MIGLYNRELNILPISSVILQGGGSELRSAKFALNFRLRAPCVENMKH